MESVSSFVESVNFYQTTRRNSSERGILHGRNRENLESHWLGFRHASSDTRIIDLNLSESQLRKEWKD
jgi:hypothetical protein